MKASRRVVARRTHGALIGLALVAPLPLVFAPVPLVVAAESAGDLETRVKAAFLYNFAKFVKWPDQAFAEPKSPLVIGVVGDDPFKGTLDQTVGGKLVDGRSIVVKRFAKRSDDIRECHVLYLAQSESEHVESITGFLADAPVLTVSDVENFTRRGGIIRFYEVDHRVRFEVNLDHAKRIGLVVSSQLLKVATVVPSPDSPKR